eukprot:TRINITY_DN5592_c0_g1_i1.p1 TRINITY_DN5592_c0_g1~~TRINITY_DN5592_c0_g1_i1.p1  ORF type:complete len:275 (+),score=43.33 TRINITY_DN5592_c0_g1_i1:137-961(+)
MQEVTDFFNSLSFGKKRNVEAAREASWRSTGIVSLRDTKLKAFPPAVLALGPAVRTLDATHNQIVEVPPTIHAFTNIQRLILTENSLTSLPPSIGRLKSLKVLALDSNRLTGLPEEVGLLDRLERLSLSGNALQSLPVSIGRLQKLVQIDVRQNRIRELPSSIGGCQALEEIMANGNLIQGLPDSMCQLKNLKTLGLDQNRVSKLPPSLLIDCRALQTLSLHGNPITVEVVEQMDGYAAFEGRRRDKVDKQLAGNVMMDLNKLDDGLDRGKRHK